ncbi:MAG: L,D-transpeptidase family protein [Chitinophagaceae bacterium]|jgi:murein L,D-transpeptidase YafK|nr:L,D-transpeptidase family protein [Chitinophagaceae bacterium]
MTTKILQAQSSIASISGAPSYMMRSLNKTEDTLRKKFAEMGLEWPAKEVYFRSFKYDSQLEVWVRNNKNEPFKLFKSYKVCALAGAMGPKRKEGDFQVPEGFYYISEFNPRSEYHLSLRLNYPNESDKMLSDSKTPGSGIYIHGSCVTVGCIPLRDEQIEEVYLIALAAKTSGQDFIPVHVFPIRFNNNKSVSYLTKVSKDNYSLQRFAISLKDAYDYFEDKKNIPLISVNKKGEYVILN